MTLKPHPRWTSALVPHRPAEAPSSSPNIKSQRYPSPNLPGLIAVWPPAHRIPRSTLLLCELGDIGPETHSDGLAPGAGRTSSTSSSTFIRSTLPPPSPPT
ncbi:hypothetical protein CF336_g9493 [Tilletia laevis]|nr:hypothetical protein CF336_g9493 [Tilletia laevis]